MVLLLKTVVEKGSIVTNSRAYMYDVSVKVVSI